MTRFLRSINSAESNFVSAFRPKSPFRNLVIPTTRIINRRLFSSEQPNLAARSSACFNIHKSAMNHHQSLNSEYESSCLNPNVVVAEDGTGVPISEVDGVQQLRNDCQSECVEGRRELPEELAKNLMVLTCESSAEGGRCVVYVIGTAHVSRESCGEVQEVVSCLKPQVVFLELCNGRASMLTHQQNMKVPTAKEMFDSLRKKQNPFGILYSWFLAKVANQLEVFPGAEFRVAFDEAMKYGGKVVLGDRSLQVTLQRTWAKLPLWQKMKLLCSLFFQSLILPSATDLARMLKEMNDLDMLTLVVQEMSKRYPTLIETVIHERDRYMSSTLLKVARENSSVVAVVGKGHLRGIKDYWQKPINLSKLMEMPSHKPYVPVKKIMGALAVGVAVGVAVGAIFGGHFLSRKK